MSRTLCLVFAAVTIGCSTPRPVWSPALRAQETAAAIALQMAMTDACLGLCQEGFVCEAETSACVPDPCLDTPCDEGDEDPQDGAAIAARLERLFDPRPELGGGDGAYSVDLGDGRTLWLLNDVWVGPITGDKRGPGATIIHNAIGVVSHEAPEPGEPEPSLWVHHRADGERPAAWLEPATTTEPERWYWLADGMVLPDTGQLAIFLWEIERTKADGGTWDFQRRGGAIALVDRPDQDPRTWQPRVTALPFSVGPGEVAWGADIVVDPSPTEEAQVLVFGTRTIADPPSRDLLVARIAAAEVEHTDAWTFWSGSEWQPDVTKAAAVASGVTDELSLHVIDEEAGSQRWILIHSDPSLGPALLSRDARSPVGPFSSPRELGDLVAEPAEGTFTYGAKGHDHLSVAGDLIVSYVVNHDDFGRMAADLSIYRPRFVEVPLSAALGEADAATP